MDKKSFTNKITFKLFEEFTADQAKIPNLVEQLKSILAELKATKQLSKITVDNYEYIQLKDWKIDGGKIWNTYDEDESHETDLWINHNTDTTAFIITFRWWSEKTYEEFSDISGPYSEWEINVNVESVYHYTDGSDEIIIPLTKENDQLAEDIIFEVNKNNM